MSCTNPACEPIEQIRGQMRPGDYYDVIAANRKQVQGGISDPELYGYPIYDRSTQRKIQVETVNGPAWVSDPTDMRAFDIPENIRPEHCIEMNETMADHFRICCKTCGKATPWGAHDFPNMPGAGADWIRKKWNESLSNMRSSASGG